MRKGQIKNKATRVLRAFYAKHKEILAIYLWGSVTTNDFDPKKSDIDSVAFVKENVPIGDETKAIKTISKQLPGLSMRFVYLSELRGAALKGNLARFADYRLLGIDFPYWKHVAGIKFTTKKLKVKTITTQEAIQLTLRQIWHRNLWEIRHERDKEKYFVKAMMRLCFYIQQQRKKNHAFSYSYVKKIGNNETRDVVDALLIVKRNSYNKKIFMEYLPLFLNFLKASKKKYGLEWSGP